MNNLIKKLWALWQQAVHKNQLTDCPFHQSERFEDFLTDMEDILVDMFKNYEQRGKAFKKAVNEQLERKIIRETRR